MKAVILKDIGDVDQLSVEEVSIPDIKEDEILIKTKATSVNPIEVKTRKGNVFSKSLLQDNPSILGWDAAGMVEKTGKNIKEFKPGNRVFGIIGFPKFGKTYAEYLVAKEQDLALIPDAVSFEQAAVSTIGALTPYQALRDYGKLGPTTKVLIHAASGGVGHFGVQLAKLFGAEIWATASEEKRDFVMSLGADHFIDYKTEKFEEVAKEMDVVFDLIGGDYIDRSLKSLKKGGILISIPSATNEGVVEKAEKAGCIGVRFSIQNNQADMKAIASLLEEQKIIPHISQAYSLDQIREAHKSLEKGHTKGKIVITVA